MSTVAHHPRVTWLHYRRALLFVHARTAPFARALRGVLLAALSCCALACGGGNYGHTRTYEPLLTEKPHFDRAQELSYEQVKRAPYDYKSTLIAWFGVVEHMEALPDGRTELLLAFRVHQARHLCKDEYQDSCRVTVSETSNGDFVARVALPAHERDGDERVWAGSLLKLYGTPTGDYDQHGNPVIDVTYHRHWPRGRYVTTAQRGAMKR